MAKKKPRSYEELLAEVRFLRANQKGDAWARVAEVFIKWAGAVGIALCVRYGVGDLAGKTTVSELLLRFVGNLEISKSFAYLFGSGGILLWLRERGIRKKSTERMQSRSVKLEQQLDPGRSSSQLTPRGETNPADRD